LQFIHSCTLSSTCRDTALHGSSSDSTTTPL
jgi:hypothetical protein